MSKYYSLDLRRRAARYCLKHGSGKTAETFSIGRATAVCWAQKLRHTDDVTIGKVGGHRLPVLEGQEDWLRQRIRAESHVSLRRLQTEFADRGIVVSYEAVRGAVRRLGLSFKKVCSPRRPQGLTLPAGGACLRCSRSHTLAIAQG